MLDVRVTDNNAASYVGRSVSVVLSGTEEEIHPSTCLLLSYTMHLLLLLLYL